MKMSDSLIFVVDDNEYNLKKITQELKAVLRCNIVGYTSPKDCIKELHRKPDMILSDYYLDGEGGPHHQMNGGQMLSIIKQQKPDIPVIMYSSKTNIDLAVKLLKTGATDFIPREKSKEGIFLRKVSSALKQQLIKIKEHHEDVFNKNTVIASCIGFCLIIFSVQYMAPDALPYVILSLVVLLTVAAFFGKPITEKIKKIFWNEKTDII